MGPHFSTLNWLVIFQLDCTNNNSNFNKPFQVAVRAWSSCPWTSVLWLTDKSQRCVTCERQTQTLGSWLCSPRNATAGYKANLFTFMPTIMTRWPIARYCTEPPAHCPSTHRHNHGSKVGQDHTWGGCRFPSFSSSSLLAVVIIWLHHCHI